MEKVLAQQRQLEGQALRLEADRRRLMQQVTHIDAQLRGLRARVAYLRGDLSPESMVTARGTGDTILVRGEP